MKTKNTLFISLITFIIILTQCSTFFAATINNGLLGDVNNDDKISIRDATLIQMYCAEIISLSNEETIKADVNEDDNVDIKDVTFLQKYLAGLVADSNIGTSYTEPTTGNGWLPGFFD